jgi:hypothetical protein
MKTIITIFLAIITLTGNAQIKSPFAEKKSLPAYFLDSVKIDNAYLTYLNPDDIAAVNVYKDAKLYPNGAVFIALKDHTIVNKLLNDKLLSLNDIFKANVHEPDRRKPVVYLINDELLTDTSNIRIPSIFVKYVTIVKASETPYFKTALPNILLMKISTRPPTIRLRGEVASK